MSIKAIIESCQVQVLNFKREFESLNMQEEETINKYADYISLIVSNIRLFGKDLSNKDYGKRSCNSF